MEKKEFISLIDRYLEGKANELEEQQLANYAHSFQDQHWDEVRLGSKSEAIARMRVTLLAEVKKTTQPIRHIHSLQRQIFRYAAAVIVLVAGLGTLFVLEPWESKRTETAQVKLLSDVQPASKRAYVTLGDGKRYEIADLKAGEHLGDAIKTADGKLVYNNTVSGVVTKHTVTVPRGGEPQLVELPDGTDVWLNTASSITYPTRFDGQTREVTITGEAYFEVTKTGQAFDVQTRTDKIEVLGTHFNINSYEDEGMVKTTLLEGKVKIGNTILKPNEQYVNGNVSIANIAQVMAWRNGLFSFGNGVDVETLMRNLSRWYDVDVVFEGAPTKRIFEGDISRSLTLKEALEGLQFTSLNYRIEKTDKVTRIVMIP